MDLALQFRMPLYKLLNEMPYDEYMAWLEYFKQKPIGVAEDYRAAMIIAATAPKAPLSQIFPTLAAQSSAHNNGLIGSKFFDMMQKSCGGIKLS